MVRPTDGLPIPALNTRLTEAMRLLRSVSYGRIVFTRDALPAVRPVNHNIDDGEVIIRTRLTAKISFNARSDPHVVVAYEADDIDPIRHVGCSVVVTGVAHTVTGIQLTDEVSPLIRNDFGTRARCHNLGCIPHLYRD